MTTAPNLIREQLLALADEMKEAAREYRITEPSIGREPDEDSALMCKDWESRIRSLAAEPVVSDTAASGREAVGRIDEGDDGAFVELYPNRTLPLNAEVYLHPPAADVVAWRNWVGQSWAYFDGDDDPRDVHDNGKPYQRLIPHPDDIRTVTQEGLDRG